MPDVFRGRPIFSLFKLRGGRFYTRARGKVFPRCCSNVNEEMEMPLHREKSNKEERVPHIKWTRLCNVLCMRAPSFVPCTDIVLDTSESAASSTGAYLFLSNLSNVQISFSLRLPFIIITPPRFLCDSRSNFFFLFILSFYYFKCKSCFQFFFQSDENVSSENFHSKLDCFQSFSKLKLINKKIYMYIYINASLETRKLYDNVATFRTLTLCSTIKLIWWFIKRKILLPDISQNK